MGRIDRPTVLLLLATIALLHEVPAVQGTAAAAAAGITIVYDPQHESAARELRRYLHQLAELGTDLAQLSVLSATALSGRSSIDFGKHQGSAHVVLAGPRAIDGPVNALLDAALPSGVWAGLELGADAGTDDHVLHSPSPQLTICHGASILATKYCVFSLLEAAGVGFRLDGQDAVPRIGLPAVLAQWATLQHQRMSPGTIEIRGMQPFHDFSEGPDQWNLDDYKLHIEQMVKLKMNFIGLHTYPNQEPTVWTGLKSQFDPASGDVNASYPTSYMTTGGGGDWGGTMFPTTDNYTFGTRLLMAGGPLTPECFGSDLLDGHGTCCPKGDRCTGRQGTACPCQNSSMQNELFNSVGDMLSEAFTHASELGVKTCLGTEAPLAHPPTAGAATTAVDLYRGIIARLKAKRIPLNYYWSWTSESWSTGAGDPGTNASMPMDHPAIADVLADFLALDAAAKVENAEFELATCGWSLGPKGNRSYFDVLPAGWTLSSINEAVGNTPTEKQYADVTHHKSWAIPWMEDDPGLLAPQLWVNRTLEYSAQAASYGVSGLLGIHWRVKEVMPQFVALAQYPWQRNLTSENLWASFFAQEFGAGPVAAAAAKILSGVDSFKLPRPDGWVAGPGQVLPHCDPAIETTYQFVTEFKTLRSQIKDPASLSRFDFWANSLQYMKEIATAGCAWVDLNGCMQKISHEECTIAEDLGCFNDCPRQMNVTIAISGEFTTRQSCMAACNTKGLPYAGVEFAAACFCSASRPSASAAIQCPKTMMPCAGNASETCGAGCILEAFNFTCKEPESVAKRKAEAELCVPKYSALVDASRNLTNALLGAVSTTGTIGSVENLMQHSFPAMLTTPQLALEAALGEPLPSHALPGYEYTGADRLFLTTPRQQAEKQRPLRIRAFLLTKAAPTAAPSLHYRAMGERQASPTVVEMQLKMSGRGVYTAEISASAMTGDIEYWLTAGDMVWPAGGPASPHTVVVA